MTVFMSEQIKIQENKKSNCSFFAHNSVFLFSVSDENNSVFIRTESLYLTIILYYIIILIIDFITYNCELSQNCK